MTWRRIAAERVATLPPSLHWTGGPNAWTQAARPGQRLHSFLEGPAWVGGSLLIADVPYGRVFRLDGADWTLAWQGDGQPHSAKPLPDGRVAVADFLLGLRALDLATGAAETLCRGPNTEAFRGLSDLAVQDGRIWLTDSGRSSLADPTGRVFVWQGAAGAVPAPPPEAPQPQAPSDTPRLRTALTNAPYPNGIALSPDGRHVYVAMTRDNAVWRLDAHWGDAPPMAGVWLRLSGGLGPDGLAVDPSGRVAIAQAQAGRAYVVDALGDPIARVDVGGPWTTAVAWAPDGTLYITEAQEGAVWAARI